MRKPRLTDRSLPVNGKLAHAYDTPAGTFTVHDSARNALLLFELFDDKAFSMEDKLEIAIRMVFAKPEEIQHLDPKALLNALNCVLSGFCGLELLTTHKESYEAPVFDWTQDAARIKASLLMAYGLDWEECSKRYTYAEVCDLLGMLLETGDMTPFSEAVYYRTAKPPKRSEHNGEYVSSWLKRRSYFSMDRKTEETENAVDRQLSDMFESLWKAAQSG